MKNNLIAVLALLMMSTVLLADDTPSRSSNCQYRTDCTFDDWHDPWTKADTARQAAFLTLLYIDARQTLEMQRNNWTDSDGTKYHESNRILGEHPSRSRIINYNLAVAALHTGLAYLAPAPVRHAMQYVGIFVEAESVNHNYRAGIRIGTSF